MYSGMEKDGKEGTKENGEEKERSSSVMDGGAGGLWLRWRGVVRKSETERFLPDLQHNHPMCLRLAWQRHH